MGGGDPLVNWNCPGVQIPGKDFLLRIIKSSLKETANNHLKTIEHNRSTDHKRTIDN